MSLAADRAYCRAILPQVSRTFALGIRLLPHDLGESVQTAYLLCRIADTIEDSPALGADRQTALLSGFGAGLADVRADLSALHEAFDGLPGAEAELAASAARVHRVFHDLSPTDIAAIAPWVREMSDGMAEFARLARSHPEGLTALASVADLDRYCYYVAGTVGHLLTALFQQHHGGIGADRFARLDSLATSFGLGLQLTNIIKDVADDRRRGWSFVPEELCRAAGIHTADLQDPARAAEARSVMLMLITKAQGHLDDALRYCLLLPRRAWRIRVFCLTSLYFAVATLRRAERDPRLLDPTHKVKITRKQVYRTVAVTHAIAASNALVRGYFRHLATT